jgi:quercetin dioxygenase-like cupin family protein
MTEADLRPALVAEGVPPATVEAAPSTTWGNGPGDRYAAHRHGFDKVLLALAGSITFDLPELGRTITLTAGDRLDLPSGSAHAAVVGPRGVECLELHLPAGSLAALPGTGRGGGAQGGSRDGGG